MSYNVVKVSDYFTFLWFNTNKTMLVCFLKKNRTQHEQKIKKKRKIITDSTLIKIESNKGKQENLKGMSQSNTWKTTTPLTISISHSTNIKVYK